MAMLVLVMRVTMTVVMMHDAAGDGCTENHADSRDENIDERHGGSWGGRSWKYEDQNSCHPDEAIGEQSDSD